MTRIERPFDLEHLEDEWLEADGFGGFASGTAGTLRTRRYHALLLTATRPPAGRVVLVNGIEAWLEANGMRYPLTMQRYAPDVVFPDMATFLCDFDTSPWPTWRFEIDTHTCVIAEVFVAKASCETALRWRMERDADAPGDTDFSLHVRPLLSGRDYHAMHHENSAFDFTATVDGERVQWRPYGDLPPICAMTNGTYEHAPDWYRNFCYVRERERGLDFTEDLATPGVFTFDLQRDEAAMVLSADMSELSTSATTQSAAAHASALAETETARRAGFASRLQRSADAYVVSRAAGRTIVAGFPWFTDWGRDTFIAMRGLLIATQRLAEAEAILLAWASTISEGMCPNRFPDDGGEPEYNSVDASLWFAVAVHDYLSAGHVSFQTQQTLHKAVEKILYGYTEGTRYGIRADDDGLLRAGVPGVQLTWMDAKIGDWVVTPRIGKPVEVQALWFNALRIAAQWNARWAKPAETAAQSFAARFIDAQTGALFDVVDVDHERGTVDRSVRPNQIFAVGGLPFALVEGETARAVIAQVESELLTPIGLRTLSPRDPGYRGRYTGTPLERDGAYHQGTVWPWLLGPFVEAWVRVQRPDAAALETARARFLAPLDAHLDRAGLDHVSEVADGDAPHTPGGTPFQAWSVGERLRMGLMLGES
jgi:predicted glycogen debranching enzyme